MDRVSSKTRNLGNSPVFLGLPIGLMMAAWSKPIGMNAFTGGIRWASGPVALAPFSGEAVKSTTAQGAKG